MLMKKFAALLVCCLVATSAMAQDATEANATVADATVKTVAPQSVKVMLNKEGTLEGKAFLTDSNEAASNAKVSLTADGKVIDAVETDEKGNFAFANVAPGAYQMLGSADGYIGSQAYDVAGYASPAVSSCSACSLGMTSAPSDVVYDNYGSAPVSSLGCGACSSPCGNPCGGGFGGGRLGGRLGGGLLSNGRIGLIGLVGLAGLGGDDTSPDR